MSKRIFMIAGPNGSGKTTTALALIPNCNIIYEYINADEIARALAPLHPESVSLAASKLMLSRLSELLKNQKNIAFETTGAGINYVKHLKNAQSAGYEVHLLFLWLSTPELAVGRVEQRVLQGGHYIPKDTVIRRYWAGLRNLVQLYLPIAEHAIVLDNSVGKLNKIILKKNGSNLSLLQPNIWQRIQEAANESNR